MRVFRISGRLFFDGLRIESVEARIEREKPRIVVPITRIEQSRTTNRKYEKKTTPNWKWSVSAFIHSIGNLVCVVHSPYPNKRESDEANQYEH